MLMEEVDAKVITREMVARQAAEEATTWVLVVDDIGTG